jgi:hypothetical protein
MMKRKRMRRKRAKKRKKKVKKNLFFQKGKKLMTILLKK